MKKWVHLALIALVTFLLTGAAFDYITGKDKTSVTGAIAEEAIHDAIGIYWDFSVVRFLYQILMTGGVTAGVAYLQAKHS